MKMFDRVASPDDYQQEKQNEKETIGLTIIDTSRSFLSKTRSSIVIDQTEYERSFNWQE
jgi:hypothetical protein